VLCSAYTISQSNAFDCTNVITKESEGVLNWLGNITFIVPTPTGPDGWKMNIVFDQPFTGIGVWDVWVESHGDDKWAAFTSRDNHTLTAGEPYSFRFRINYPDRNIKPEATSLKFIDIELCR